jgi:hypothetical protein
MRSVSVPSRSTASPLGGCLLGKVNRSAIADTFGGRVHVECEAGERAAMTPLGQLPFFIEYLKQGGLFDGWSPACMR